jgi:integrase/recombinase XerC
MDTQLTTIQADLVVGAPPALVAAWLSGRSEKTVRAYRRDLEDFSCFVRAESIDQAASALLGRGQGPANALALAYKHNLKERGLQPTTTNRRLSALRSLIKLARTMGMIPWALDVDNEKVQAYRDTRGPGLDNVRRMLELVRLRRDRKGWRDEAILRLLYDIGLREGELVALDVEDVDTEASRLTILGKGRTQSEALTLPSHTLAALEAWLAVRGLESGPLFTRCTRAAGDEGRLTPQGVYDLIRRLGQRLGFAVRPHGLRHTSITEAVKAASRTGADLTEVMQFSRHKDIRTLTLYRDNERDMQGQLAAMVAAGV